VAGSSVVASSVVVDSHSSVVSVVSSPLTHSSVASCDCSSLSKDIGIKSLSIRLLHSSVVASSVCVSSGVCVCSSSHPNIDPRNQSSHISKSWSNFAPFCGIVYFMN